jgi:WD40 repeat protein
MFDLRCNQRVRAVGSDSSDADGFLNADSSPVPIYTCSSQSGNVMVCFSPNDLYFLSSAVDNEVRQYHVRDGALHLEYAIPKHHSKTNFTRSYYMNEGEAIISGASNSDLLYIASSRSARRRGQAHERERP